jgi:hypothetical protein
MAQRLLSDIALAFTPELGWHYVQAPPDWWWQLQEDLLEADAAPRARLSLVPALPALEPRVTSCRPGSGPCRRHHEHASARRSA